MIKQFFLISSKFVYLNFNNNSRTVKHKYYSNSSLKDVSAFIKSSASIGNFFIIWVYLQIF